MDTEQGQISHQRSFTWFAAGVAATLCLTGVVIGVRADAAPGATEATFVPITPCRLFDTRPAPNTVGQRKAPIATDETFTQQVTGANGDCTIPSDATGVAMNVTALNATAPSFLQLWPADAAQPERGSSLNYGPGQPPTPNKVDVKLSTSGAVNIYNLAGSVDVIGDVVGYYTRQGLQDIVDDLATKADASDVYTKAEIDARSFDAVVGGGFVTETGALSRAWGDISVTRNGTGQYTVTIGGLNPCASGFGNLTAQVTLLNRDDLATNGFASTGFQNTTCPAGILTLGVRTANAAGAADDLAFQIVVFAGGSGVSGVANAPLTESVGCQVIDTSAADCNTG